MEEEGSQRPGQASRAPSTLSRVELEGGLAFREVLVYTFLHDPSANLWSNWVPCAIGAGMLYAALSLLNLTYPLHAVQRFLPGDAAFPVALLFVLGFMGFLMPCWIAIAKARHKTPDLAEPAHFTFDSAGYEVLQAGLRYRVDWTSVREIRESKSMFLLYLNPTQRTILPKRFFPDAPTLAAWRALIAASAPSVPIRSNSLIGRLL